MSIDDYMEDALEASFEEPEDICTCECCGIVITENKFTNCMEHENICDDCFDRMRRSLKKFLSGEASEMDPIDKTIAYLYLNVLEYE